MQTFLALGLAYLFILAGASEYGQSVSCFNSYPAKLIYLNFN